MLRVRAAPARFRGAATSTAASGVSGRHAAGDSRESLLHRALPVYLGLLFAILTVVAVLLLFMVRHVLLVLFVSVLFAAALTGPSEWLHRRSRLPLGLAAVLIYIACFALILGIGWVVVPPLLGQVVEFADRAPEYAERYEGSSAALDSPRCARVRRFPAVSRPDIVGTTRVARSSLMPYRTGPRGNGFLERASGSGSWNSEPLCSVQRGTRAGWPHVFRDPGPSGAPSRAV